MGRGRGDGTMENTTDSLSLKKGEKQRKKDITSDGFTEEIQLYYLDITHESRQIFAVVGHNIVLSDVCLLCLCMYLCVSDFFCVNIGSSLQHTIQGE